MSPSNESNMMRVIVLDNLSEEGLELLRNNESLHVEIRTGLSGEELRLALAEFDGAICRSGVTITAESLEGNKRLRAIVRAGVGTDNIDKVAATRQGIVVMNTPTGNTVSTAEHTIALMLALSRNIAPANQSLVEGRWDRKKYMGSQLAGKTLGIVGLGRIGLTVATRAQALEMRTIGYDPFMSKDRASELGIERYDNIDDMLPEVDYLTVHTPLTDETRGLFGTAQLDMIKPGARLINCARGGLYEEAALINGLESGRLAGVALDVFEQEPCKDSPLFGMAGVLCTPHLGASTEEAQTQVALEAVNLLVDYLTKGDIRCAVNVSPIDSATLSSLRGYLDVAYRLGLLLAQLDPCGAKACRLRYRGEVAEKDTKLLTASFACGLLSQALATEPNIINAEVLLKERGIELTQEQESAHGAFSSLVQAELESSAGTFTAGGTIFGRDMPRLVQLNDNQLEAYLDGVLLIFPHKDVPGIIGSVGTTLGKYKVNIAQMSVGRSIGGGDSIGILNLDDAPPEEAIEEVRAHGAIRDVTVIRLPRAGELPAWMAGE